MPIGTRLTEFGGVVLEAPVEDVAAHGIDQTCAYVANWFSGDVVKVSLQTVGVLARVRGALSTLFVLM